MLLKSGADINAINPMGYTTTMNMAILQHYDRVVWLIERGADMRVMSRSGVSLAVLIANDRVQLGSPQYPWRQKIVDLLVAKGLMAPAPQSHK